MTTNVLRRANKYKLGSYGLSVFKKAPGPYRNDLSTAENPENLKGGNNYATSKMAFKAQFFSLLMSHPG